MGTINVVKLGGTVSAMHESLSSLSGQVDSRYAALVAEVRACRDALVEAEAVARSGTESVAERVVLSVERLDGLEAQLPERLAAVEASVTGRLTRTIPGVIADGIAQSLGLAVPGVTASLAATVTAEILAALPRLQAGAAANVGGVEFGTAELGAGAFRDDGSDAGSVPGGRGSSEDEGINWI